MAASLVVICSYGQSTKTTTSSNAPNQNPANSLVPNVGFFKLHLNSGKKNYSTDFYFNNASTKGLDIGYDAGMPMGGTPNFSIYSKLLEGREYSQVDFAIQSLPYSILLSTVSIPVSVNIDAGLECSIKISESYLSPEIKVYLEDTLTNTVTLINTSAYKFTTTTTLSGEGRFNIRFSSFRVTLSSEANVLESLKIFNLKSEKSIAIKGILTEKTDLKLYDLQGRLVSKYILDNGSSFNQLDVTNINPGIYIILLQNSTHQKTQKVMIR